MELADARHLANLSRLALTDEELSGYAKDMDAILGYIEKIKGAVGDAEAGHLGHASVHNVMRDDVITNEPGSYTKAILASAPSVKDGRVEVKKVLSTGDEA
jgi:aspartyl-tRNA(Asn)/glutamyl-tRNA(Gln) amidotransferase subunit C